MEDAGLKCEICVFSRYLSSQKMVKKSRRNSEKSFGGPPYKVAEIVNFSVADFVIEVKLDLLSGGDTPHEMLVKVEMEEEMEKEAEEQGQRSMMVRNQQSSFQGTLTRWLSSPSALYCYTCSTDSVLLCSTLPECNSYPLEFS